MSLPKPRDRGAIRAFWMSLSLLAGAVVTGVAAVLFGPASIWVGPAVAALLALPGLVWPGRFDLAYRAWNRLAGIVGRHTSDYVARVCFGTVVLAARDGEDRMLRRRPYAGRSLWLRRPPHEDGTYATQHVVPTPDDPPQRWWTATASWARAADSRWLWAVIPFLALLRVLDTTDGGSAGATPPQDTYTLY